MSKPCIICRTQGGCGVCDEEQIVMLDETWQDDGGRLNQLYEELCKPTQQQPVSDELQSEIRMLFNEALAGGPNVNGDGGPTLTFNHAVDCIWAAQRIAVLAQRIDQLELAVEPLALLAGGINMNDPLSKWFTFAQFIKADEVLRAKITSGSSWPSDAVFGLGSRVKKKGRASWRGTVVGWYRTELTALGLAVESYYEPGSVQIYSQSALEPWDGGMRMELL